MKTIMEGDRVYDSNNSDVMALLENSNNSLWVQPSPTLSFHETMMNFDHEPHKGRRLNIKRDYDNDNGDDDVVEEFELNPNQTEKKRRLSPEKVECLEKSFEMDNKLEPERKLELAKKLELQPRQVAIWFQNRRARYKTKQLEKEYGSLKASHDRLKLAFDSLSKEYDCLQNEMKVLMKKLKQRDEFKTSPANPLQHLNLVMPEIESEMTKETGLLMVAPSTTTNDQLIEQASSTKSDIVDSESPHWTNGNHSDPTDQQSDFSLGKEENLMINITSPINFLKVEENECYDLNNNASSCNFSLVDDQPFWSMLY